MEASGAGSRVDTEAAGGAMGYPRWLMRGTDLGTAEYIAILRPPLNAAAPGKGM
jgi:hypothetical protein